MKNVTPGRAVDVPRRAARYTPDGDAHFRDTLNAAIDSVRPDQRVGLALHFLVTGMDALARYAPTPSQKGMASTYAEIARDLIPADIVEMVEKAKKKAGG